MAEERLIDDDKDRRYKIRKNENGEEELVFDDSEDEEPLYGVDCENDGEIVAEQLDEEEEKRREGAQRKIDELKSIAEEKINAGDFEGAQAAVQEASNLTEYDGELYYLELKAWSRNLTDFSALQQCVDSAEGVAEYTGEEQKAELYALSNPLKQKIRECEEQCEKLSAENESGKAARRGTFKSAQNRSLIYLSLTVVPLVAFFVLAMVFYSEMYADKNGLFIILTIVFASATAVMLLTSIVTANRFLRAHDRVRLNEKNSATQIGRQFIECNEQLEKLNKIYSSLGNDIS